MATLRRQSESAQLTLGPQTNSKTACWAGDMDFCAKRKHLVSQRLQPEPRAKRGTHVMVVRTLEAVAPSKAVLPVARPRVELEEGLPRGRKAIFESARQTEARHEVRDAPRTARLARRWRGQIPVRQEADGRRACKPTCRPLREAARLHGHGQEELVEAWAARLARDAVGWRLAVTMEVCRFFLRAAEEPAK